MNIELWVVYSPSCNIQKDVYASSREDAIDVAQAIYPSMYDAVIL